MLGMLQWRRINTISVVKEYQYGYTLPSHATLVIRGLTSTRKAHK